MNTSTAAVLDTRSGLPFDRSTSLGKHSGTRSPSTGDGAISTRGATSTFRPTASSPKDLTERLYGSRAEFKIAVANIAMHLNDQTRQVLFRQIDAVLDEDEWDPEDVPVAKASSLTFIRTLLFLKPARLPGLGVTHDGCLVASWGEGRNTLSIECRRQDSVRWIVSALNGDVHETAAGTAQIGRLFEVLAPWNPRERWFDL